MSYTCKFMEPRSVVETESVVYRATALPLSYQGPWSRKTDSDRSLSLTGRRFFLLNYSGQNWRAVNDFNVPSMGCSHTPRHSANDSNLILVHDPRIAATPNRTGRSHCCLASDLRLVAHMHQELERVVGYAPTSTVWKTVALI